MKSPEYLAGFFDGEGCVNITVAGKNRQATLRVYLINTHKAILQEIQEQFGGKIYPLSRKATWKQAWQLVFLHETAIHFLKTIEPFSTIKQPQIKLALDFHVFMKSKGRCEGFINSYGSVSRRRTQATLIKEAEFKSAMSKLNTRGIAAVN